MQTLFSSLHTHTTFCDGKDDVETMCRSAFEKGLTAIGLSAHAPMEKTGLDTSWHLKESQVAAYREAVHAARRRWKGKLAVYLGLEIDYVKGLRSALDSDVIAMEPDYLIGSTHYVIPPRGEPFTVDGPAAITEQGVTKGFGGNGEAMMNAYWDAVLEMIALGGFDIIGHLDLVRRSGRWFNMESDAYMRRAEEAVNALAVSNIVVEVNTGGMNRGYFTEPYPSAAILRMLRQCNVPVMISADAHCAEHLDGNYQYAGQVLREAGYTEHVIFQGRANGKAVWKEYAIEKF